MKQRHLCLCPFLTALLLTGAGVAFKLKAQNNPTNQTAKDKIVVAGSQYNKSASHQWFWGRHYRHAWSTPVKVEVLYLDTAMGGLIPYETGGSNQTRTLRLRTADNKEYVLRSIDKSYEKALPEIYRNTFIENIANDQISSIHPYSAVTIPPMAAAAGIYYTQPLIRFVPKQPALGVFNDEFGDKLYIFEQRPDGDWSEAENLGKPEKIISTEKLLEKLLKDNDHLVDQTQYVRSRLFDMFIGDWSRSEDQWKWAAIEKEGNTLYQPIPRDHDQAYAKYDGTLLRIVLSSTGLSHMESFKEDIKDITTFNFTARNLDRRMANECDLQVWINEATQLQRALTDDVIESAVKQLPPEVFTASAARIIQKLKARRNKLQAYARKYYEFLAKDVDVPGSEKPEHFEIARLNESQLKLSIYKINKDGIRETTPFYQRIFNEDVTKEVRLYGIAGNDTYQVNGEVKNDIELRIVGGKDKDVITDISGSKNEVRIYDDKNNILNTSPHTKVHLSNDDDIHNYKYDAFEHDRKGFRPVIFFNNVDRFYVGLGYQITKQGWRKEPFAYQHGVYARYSITQNAISFGYKGILNQFVGNWDLHINGDYDAVRWTNFFGIGNESVELTDKEQDYYRVRTKEIYAGIGLNRRIGDAANLRFTPFYQATKIINDEGRFITETFDPSIARSSEPNSYHWDHYAGLAMNFSFAQVDDDVVTTKGIAFATGLAHTKSLESRRAINSATGILNIYIPITRQLVWASRNGGATLTGDPKFYQLNSIGGSQNLRGYRRDRFRGRSAFYTSNELQWQFDVRSNLFNGKAGPVAFYDIGRVWEPGEVSRQWHSGYGAGFMIAPFNKVNVSVTYGISKESKVFHLRLNKAF